jgi:hypothetical protein
MRARAESTKGSRKWRLKNRFRVALDTLNPPQMTVKVRILLGSETYASL